MMLRQRAVQAAATAYAAAWTLRAVLVVRWQLRHRPLDALAPPRARKMPPVAERAALAVLRRLPATCLEEAVVRQAWLAAHGAAPDLIIGVTAPSAGFEAHAWLDGDAPCHQEGFQELFRRPARR